MDATTFESLEPNTIKRIDSTHILDIFLGLGLRSEYTILVVSHYDMSIPKSTKYIKIRKDKRTEQFYYFFILEDQQNLDIFIDIFNDIIEYSRQFISEIAALKKFLLRFILWNNIFKKESEKSMSQNQIIGLIGELYFLSNYLLSDLGMNKALNSWFGPLSEKKDFEYNDYWNEIKMTKYGSNSVKINSIYQLDDVNAGELVVFEYSLTGPQGTNLYDLVENIIEVIDDLQLMDLFSDSLKEIGYIHDAKYKHPIVEIKNVHRITINAESDILRSVELPRTVIDVEYLLRYKEME